MKRLSDELDVDWHTLYRAIRFASEYEELPETGLSWAHYRELLTVSDPAERAFYEQVAIAEGLSRDRMLAAMKAQLHSSKRGKGGVRLKRPVETRYVYEAKLSRVVDGDTLLLLLDLGFSILKEQRVRLVSVNALSAGSKKGKDATLYVVERLAVADRIVVQTQRADLHGRFLAHVFYSTRSLGFLETFEAGHFLNQQLLDQKLAMPVK